MAPVQFMPSPHGLSKQFRLDNELACDTFPEIEDGLILDETKDLLEIDFFKEQHHATDIFMKNNQLKDLCNDMRFVSGLDSFIDVHFEENSRDCIVNAFGDIERQVLAPEASDVLAESSETGVNQAFDAKRLFQSGLQNEVTKHSIDRRHMNNLIGFAPLEDPADVANKSVKTLKDLSLEAFIENNGTSFGESLIYLPENIQGYISTKVLQRKETQIPGLKVKKSDEFRLDNRHILEDNKRNARSADKISKKSKPVFDYKRFSNVIQKARDKVKPRTKIAKPSLFLTEMIRLNKIPDKSNLVGECSRIKNNPVKSKHVTVLSDIDELSEFLDFCDTSLLHMYSQCCSGAQSMDFLLRDAQFVDIYLHNAQYTEFFGKPCISVYDEHGALETYDEFLRLGNYLSTTIVDLGNVWREALENYKMNFHLMSDTVGRFFDVPVENAIADDRDLVYKMLNQVNAEICQAQRIQKELDNYFSNLLEKLCKTSEHFVKFKQLNEKLSGIMSKYS